MFEHIEKHCVFLCVQENIFKTNEFFHLLVYASGWVGMGRDGAGWGGIGRDEAYRLRVHFEGRPQLGMFSKAELPRLLPRNACDNSLKKLMFSVDGP